MASKPQLKVLMDLSDGFKVNETSDLCFDISDIVITANTRRGRNREIDKIQAGYCVITVIDDNGNFNPDNTASPFYGKLVPGKKLRLYPLWDDGNGEFRYPDIFTGYITNYRTDFSIGVNVANKIVIEAYDGMKLFNSASITQVVNATSGDTSDERIEAILDEINWTSTLESFETSVIALDADQGDLRTVLDAIRQVEDSEAGLIYFDGSGVLQFKNRVTVNEPPNYDDAFQFSDNGVDTSYNDIRFIQDDSTLINEITVVSYNGSNEATAINTTSEDRYFLRTAERRGVLLSVTTELQDLAETLLANYEESSLQIEKFVLNLSEYNEISRLVAAFYFDIFFVPVYIEKVMPGGGNILRLGWIQGVNHDITQNTWMVTAFTGLTTDYSDAQFYYSSLQRNTTSALTGYIIDTLPSAQDAVILGVDETTPSKGLIALYEKDRTVSNIQSFSVANQGITPTRIIKDNDGKYFSIGNIDSTTDSGYYILHSTNWTSTDYAYMLYDSTPYVVEMTEATVDSTGDFYVAGRHDAPIYNPAINTTSWANFVVKISADGDTILWQKRIRFESQYKEEILPVGLFEADDYIYCIIAQYPVITTNADVRMIKFNPSNGSVVEQKTLQDTGRWTNGYTDAILDNSGHIIIVDRLSQVSATTLKRPLALYKFTTNWTNVWVSTIDFAVNTYPKLPKLYCDNDNNIYVLVFKAGVGTAKEAQIYKYDSNGNLLWSRQLGILTGGASPSGTWQNRLINSVITNDNDNLYIAGAIGNGTPEFSALEVPTIAHLPSDGTLTGTESYTLELSTGYTPTFEYISITPTQGTSGTVSFTVTNDTYLEIVDDYLTITSLTVTTTTGGFEESGVTFN